MHRTYLAGIERGARNVTLSSIAKLAHALQVAVASLLTNGVPAAEAASVVPPTPREILLVQGDAVEVDNALAAFRRANVANPMKVVRTGREALQYLKSSGRYARRQDILPQLILLDVQLPDMSGAEILRQLRADERTKALPVIALAAGPNDPGMADCRELGVHASLTKPVRFQNLSEVTPNLKLHWALVTTPAGELVE
jgi:CheY-like chemotaxis protein